MIGYDSSAPGFYGKGILRFDPFGDAHYMKFSNAALSVEQQYFVKTGAGSPENFLAYGEFYHSDKDPTSLGGVLHLYDDSPPDAMSTPHPTHVTDVQPGDPVWATTYLVRSGSMYMTESLSPDTGCVPAPPHAAGRGILGALRYLESQGVNSIYALTMNFGGDGKDVHPFANVPMPDIGGTCPTDTSAALHYSVKRMQEWTTVLQFAMQRGIAVDMVLWEEELNNLRWLSYGPDTPYTCSSPPATNGEPTWARRLYLKQMAAYLGHLHGLRWILCEEATDPCYFEVPPCPGYNPSANHAPTFTVAEISSIVAWLQRWDAIHDHPITLHTDGNEFHIYETILTGAEGNPPAPWLQSASLHMDAKESQDLFAGLPPQSPSAAWLQGWSPSEYHRYGLTVEAVRAQFDQHGGTGRKVVVDVDEQGGFARGASGSSDFPNRVDPGTYSSLLSSAVGRRRTGLYDILFSGGNVSWYAGWATVMFGTTLYHGNENHGGHDLSLDEFRSRELLWHYSKLARQQLQSVPFWLGAPNDARVTGEWNDGNPAVSYGGAEVFEHLNLSGPAGDDFILVYYPEAYASSSFHLGQVNMLGVPNPGPTFVAYFVDPRTNAVFGDSRQYFDGADLAQTGSAYHPAATTSMTAAATATSNPLHDFVLVIRRLP